MTYSYSTDQIQQAHTRRQVRNSEGNEVDCYGPIGHCFSSEYMASPVLDSCGRDFRYDGGAGSPGGCISSRDKGIYLLIGGGILLLLVLSNS